jgi:hypothetical protein
MSFVVKGKNLPSFYGKRLMANGLDKGITAFAIFTFCASKQ